MAQFLYDRASAFQLREYENSSFDPYCRVVGKILDEEEGHESFGAEIMIERGRDPGRGLGHRGRVLRVVARDDVEELGRTPRAPREHAHLIERAGVGHEPPARDAPVGGLQSDHAAEGRT